MRSNRVEASSGERWLVRGMRAALIGALVAGALSVWNEARAQSAQSAQSAGRALDAADRAPAATGGVWPAALPATSVAACLPAAPPAVAGGDR